MIDAPETSELQAFLGVADAGSVTAAAAELGLPRATVSRRLARLEERLGVKLISRTTRQLRLTDAGEELHPHARSIVMAVGAAARAVSRDDGRPRGLLRVSVPPLSSRSFREVLLRFVERYPEVDLEVIVSTRHEDLIASNIDVAVRAGQRLDPGLVARTLQRSEVVAVASPAYLARAGAPATPAALGRHACLVGFARGERPATHWPLRDGGQVRVTGRLVCNSLELLLEAACDGLGIALVPLLVARGLLERGALVRVLPEALGASTVVALVYPDKRLLRPAVRAFVDFTLAELEGRTPWETEVAALIPW